MPANIIKISNVSPKASEKTLADFFSFCGKIQNLTMRRQGASVEAIVEFESEAAAKTALLLTNALIEDRPITVTPYEEVVVTSAPPPTAEPVTTVGGSAVDSTTEPPKSRIIEFDDELTDDDDPVHVSHMRQQDIPHKPFTVPDEQRSSTSVIASLLASGYTLGVGAIDSARELDERTHISETISASATAARVKMQEIDQQYGISDTAAVVGMQIAQGASVIGETIASAWRNVDTSYQVSEKAAAATTTVSTSVRSATTAVSENPTVASTVQTLSSWGSAIGESFSTMIAPIAESASREVEQIKSATKQKIDAVDRARGQHTVDDANAGGLSVGTPTPGESTSTQQASDDVVRVNSSPAAPAVDSTLPPPPTPLAAAAAATIVPTTLGQE